MSFYWACTVIFSINKIQPCYQLSVQPKAAQGFNLATFLFCDFKDINSLYCFQLNFILLPPLLAIPFSSVFSVSPLLENNPIITNRSCPSSAPKFTLAVRLSSAVKGALGGQTCSEIYSMLNVVYTHGITCQFGLKWKPSNIILITLADVKESHSACFPY